MFGNNPIRKIEIHSKSGTLALQEVFHTIQGEGPLSGLPAVFVRLAGCHLACHFCDTEFESNIDNVLPFEEAVGQIEELLDKHPSTNLVVLTGGEPLRQRIGELVWTLFMRRKGITVQLETAGNLWDPSLESSLILEARRRGTFVIVTSPKTPKVHPNIAEWCHHYKYVIRHEEVGVDGLPCMGTQPQTKGKPVNIWREHSPKDTVWVSPCDDKDQLLNMLNMEEAVRSSMTHGYRLSLQVHKVVSAVVREVLP